MKEKKLSKNWNSVFSNLQKTDFSRKTEKVTSMQMGNFFFFFFCIFYAFQSILSRSRHTYFFFENFREHEATEDASAKPEWVKRPSSPTGLAWRGTKWLARLVYKKVCLYVSLQRPQFWTNHETWHGHSLGPLEWHGVGKVALCRPHSAKRVLSQMHGCNKEIFKKLKQARLQSQDIK